MTHKSKKNLAKGFTIVELLIVIVVIGILAALVMNTFSEAQKRAKATAVADGLVKTERSLKAYAYAEGQSYWPSDENFDNYPTANNPTLTDLIENTSLKNYLQSIPSVKGAGGEWRYDNDGEFSYDGCSNGNGGVNIIISDFTDEDLIERIDKIIDDGDINCGKFRRVYTSEMRYNISRNFEVE